MPTKTRKEIDVWTCEVCDREYLCESPAVMCEDRHIADLDQMRRKCDQAYGACAWCESEYPSRAWTEANHVWCRLSNLIANTQALVARRAEAEAKEKTRG